MKIQSIFHHGHEKHGTTEFRTLDCVLSQIRFVEGHEEYGKYMFHHGPNSKLCRVKYDSPHKKNGIHEYYKNGKISRIEYNAPHEQNGLSEYYKNGKMFHIEHKAPHKDAKCLQQSERSTFDLELFLKGIEYNGQSSNEQSSIQIFQRAIRKQIKINRECKSQTARNILETQKQLKIREECRRKAAEKESSFVTSPSGKSGPSKTTHWEKEDPSISQKSKTNSHKQISIEAAREFKRQQMHAKEMQEDILHKQFRNLCVGYSINDD